MLEMFRDLVAHKWYANAALLNAIGQQATAAADTELQALLHHVLLANRFWLLTVVGQPFAGDEESRPAGPFDALVQRYARTHAQEAAWLDTVTADELGRTLTDPQIPSGACSVAQALVQVCLHSHGHRAQAAKLLRRHHITPPATDFILWLGERPDAGWPHGHEASV
jgi:uncharacterized damage-inducible protein DinB